MAIFKGIYLFFHSNYNEGTEGKWLWATETQSVSTTRMEEAGSFCLFRLKQVWEGKDGN